MKVVPFDPELGAALEVLRAKIPALESVAAVPAFRAVALEHASDETLGRGGFYEVTHRTVADSDVRLVILRPRGIGGPVPVFYQIHGGGMILGDYRDISDEVLDWGQEFGAAIVSVQYRLAPETPHPGPVEDCYAGLAWTVAHADELGLDAARIVLVGGSAGGGLAAATALMARDRQGPAIAAQVLMCPMLDDRNDTVSASQNEDRGIWDRRTNGLGWSALLGDAAGGPDVSPYAAPARAADLSGLPPALLDVGSAEVFRDEVVAYASGIWRDGGQAELYVFSGGFHGYDMMVPQAAVSQDTRVARLGWLRRVLGA